MIVSEKRKSCSEYFSDELVEDHRNIAQLLKNLLEKRKTSLSTKFLEKLGWYLERHIYLEEKAFFTLLKEDPSLELNIDRLVGDHNKILSLVAQLKECKHSCENEIDAFH